MNIAEINFLDIEENIEYEKLINKILETCFKEEQLNNKNLYVNVVLTNSANIRKINEKYRKIDKETDVLSFPMFEKEDLENINNINIDILGDIVISIEQVEKQSKEYEHSFKRELAYMIVHGFYHLVGYDHMQEDDKKIMREKEENILQKLKILN